MRLSFRHLPPKPICTKRGKEEEMPIFYFYTRTLSCILTVRLTRNMHLGALSKFSAYFAVIVYISSSIA